jgi:hypothetical protein
VKFRVGLADRIHLRSANEQSLCKFFIFETCLMTYGAMSTQEMEPLAADRDARDPDDGHSGKALESEHAEFRQASIPILQDSLSTSIVGPILAILLQVVVAMVIALTATVDMYFDTTN